MKRLMIVASLAIVVALCAATSSKANPVLAGDDFLTTIDTTNVDLGPIVQSGPIYFNGGTSPTDTIMRRLADANFPAYGVNPYPGTRTPGTQVTIPIQLVQLNLQSTAPATIAGTNYNVTVALDPGVPSIGTMNIRHQWADVPYIPKTIPRPQGDLDAHFVVNALLTFTPVGGGNQLLQPVSLALDSQAGPEGDYTYWAHLPPGGPTQFGLFGTRFKPRIIEQSGITGSGDKHDAFQPFFSKVGRRGVGWDVPGGFFPAFENGMPVPFPEPTGLILCTIGLTVILGTGRRRSG